MRDATEGDTKGFYGAISVLFKELGDPGELEQPAAPKPAWSNRVWEWALEREDLRREEAADDNEGKK